MVLKKSIVLFAVMALSVGLYAQESEESSESVKGRHPYKLEESENVAKEYAHWSIIPHAGFNAFDGDFNSEMKHNVAVPNAGLSLEYSFTPVWNVGIDYSYDMYTVTGKPGSTHADTLLTGDMHKAGAYLSIDLINLFFPHAQKKIVSIFGSIGGGASWYKSRRYFMDDEERDPTHRRGNTANYINADGENGPDRMTEYKCLPYMQAGVGVEFNLNRTLALGVNATYSYFTKDYIDGRGFSGKASHASKNNDGIFDVHLALRFKLEAVKKSHVRNMTPEQELADAIDKNEPERKKDTVVMIIRDTVVMKEQVPVAGEGGSSSVSNTKVEYHSHTATAPITGQTFYVYFDNARSELTEQGLTIVQQLADRMLNDPDIYIDVVGMCDNTGSDEINNRLATNRALRVLDELNNEFGISTDRCLTSGRGKIVGRRSKAAYGPNRRVEIRLMSKQEFERVKAERQERGDLVTPEQGQEEYNDTESYESNYEETTSYNSGETTETLTEEDVNAGQQAVLNDPTGRTIRQKESVNAVTLTSLARKHFGNPNCWVFVYEANKDKIADINVMPVGVDITIPQLTDEQKHISKEDALVYYYRIK